MADYTITFARSARKDLEALDSVLVDRIFAKIKSLSAEPRPAGCRKLVGEKHLWRIRIGDYRVIYSIDDRSETVDVIAIRHRRDAYR
jgi:mRNA interferase RelE/StbE